MFLLSSFNATNSWDIGDICLFLVMVRVVYFGKVARLFATATSLQSSGTTTTKISK